MKTRYSSSDLDPLLVAPHYSARVVRGYLLYLEQKLGHQRARDFVGQLGIPWEFLQSENNWVSAMYSDRLLQAMFEHPEIDRSFSYEAGRLGMSKELLGVLHFLATRFLSPREVFKAFPMLARHGNRVDVIEIQSLTSNQAIFSLRMPRKGGNFDLHVDNWRGYLEHIPPLFGSPKASCKLQITGDHEALFDVTWEVPARRRTIFGGLKRDSLLAIVYVTLLFWISKESYLSGFLSILSSAVLLSMMMGYRGISGNKKSEMQDAIDSLQKLLLEMEDRYSELHHNKHELDRRFREDTLLGDLFQTLVVSDNPSRAIVALLSRIGTMFKCSEIIFMKLGDSKDQLEWESTAAGPANLAHSIPLEQPISHRDGPSMGLVTKKIREAFGTFPKETFVIDPVALGDRLHGFLVMILEPNTKDLDKEEKQFLEVIAGQIAVVLENKGLRIEALKQKKAGEAAHLGEVATQVAHDIRSPLAALNVAITEAQGLGEDYRQVIQGAVQRIGSIADQLLSQARKDQGRLKLRPEGSDVPEVDASSVEAVSALVKEIVNETRVRYKLRPEFEIKFEDAGNDNELFFQIQPVEFRRILSNLVINAVEASTEKCNVIVVLRSYEDRAFLTVSDSGKGIPPGVLARLGQKGETYGKEGGTGLGVYHAKTMIRRWGGDLAFESKVDKGTVVTITLPIYRHKTR